MFCGALRGHLRYLAQRRLERLAPGELRSGSAAPKLGRRCGPFASAPSSALGAYRGRPPTPSTTRTAEQLSPPARDEHPGASRPVSHPITPKPPCPTP
jgi:hypothetical protein